MRVDNWQKVLNEKIQEWRRRPFDWSRSDCCQFAAEIVLALTGIDHRDAFPTYDSKEQADEILTRLGGIGALVSTVLGESKPASFAQRGDIVVCDFGDGLAVGVCLGLNSVAPGPRGLVERPTLNAIAAWSV